jgi:hypothetical protein
MKVALRRGWRPLGLLVALRAAIALVLGATPATLVLDRVKYAPAGELALFEREGALFVELVRRPPPFTGQGIAWTVAALVAHIVALPLLAAFVLAVVGRGEPLSEAVGKGTRLTPVLLLVSLAGGAATVLAAYLGLLSSGSLTAFFPSGTPSRAWATGAFGALGLVPVAIVAVLVDLTRVQVVLGQGGLIEQVVRAWGLLRGAPLRLLLTYAAFALGSATVATIGLVGASAAAVRSGSGWAVTAVLIAVMTTSLLVVFRGAWLASLVRASFGALAESTAPGQADVSKEPQPDEARRSLARRRAFGV